MRLKKVLLDTGPIVGLFNDEDDWHLRCKSFFGKAKYKYVLTQSVVCEVVYMLQKSRSKKHAMIATDQFLGAVEDEIFDLCEFGFGSFGRIRQLRKQYSDQRRLDFTDLSLVIAAEILQIGEVVTIDRNDFSILRWRLNRKNGCQEKAFSVILPQM